MKVEEIMKRDVKVCRQDDNLNSAAELMWDNDCGCVPVVAFDDAGKVVGMITDRDICMAAYTQGKPLCEIAVRSAMATKVLFCKASDDLVLAEAIMREARIRRMPVVEANDTIQGIISLNDIARSAVAIRDNKAAQAYQTELARTFAAICEPRTREVEPMPQAA